MPPERREFDAQMAQLDAEIRRLESEYNQYFAGRLPRPPWVTKNRVTALVKKYDNMYIQNTADRFRFETIQTRFYKFLELVERQMANREMGRPTFGKRPSSAPEPVASASAPAAAAPKQAEAPADARRNAAESARAKADKGAAERVVKFNKAEAGADARVKELYEQLAAAKKQVGEQPVAYERVAALVKAQVSKFADDGTNVAFKIALKDGKVSLTVKPEKGEG